MNEFEKQFQALRLQYRDERLSILKDANRTIGHLNTAIGAAINQEAREALRREKIRVHQATHQSMKYSRICYKEQLELLEDQYRLYREAHPSNHQLRRMAKTLFRAAEEKGYSQLIINFGGTKTATITFTDSEK